MEKYALASAEVAYYNPGEQAQMGFMASGRKIQVSENTSPCMDRKRSSFPSLTGTNNTNWGTTVVHMSVAEKAKLKAVVRFNNPLVCWGCTESPRYHAYRSHTYINCPKNR